MVIEIFRYSIEIPPEQLFNKMVSDADGSSVGSYRQREYFEDPAIPYGYTPKSVRHTYARAIDKLRNSLQPRSANFLKNQQTFTLLHTFTVYFTIALQTLLLAPLSLQLNLHSNTDS